MKTHIEPSVIRLNQLSRILAMLNKQEGHKNDMIYIDVDCEVKSIHNIEHDIRRVIIEDVSFIEMDGMREIKFYTTSVSEFNEMPVVEIHDDYITIADFFSIMYYILDERRNVFMPTIRIDHASDESEHCIPGSEIWNIDMLKFPERKVKGFYIERSINPTKTCRFIIRTCSKEEI